MYYICYKCHLEFESNKILIGRSAVIAECPCREYSPEGLVPIADAWKYSARRTAEVQRVQRLGGELVAWIHQGANPGCVRNQGRVDRNDSKGITLISGGVCRTIVAGFCWRMLTLPDLTTALNKFSKEMRYIPKKYLKAQHTYKKSALEFNDYARARFETRKVRRDMEQSGLADFDDITPAIEEQCNERMAQADHTFNQTGFGISLKAETTETAIAEANWVSVLEVVLGSYGVYHVDLSNGLGGHSVGFWIGKVPGRFMAKELLVFVDPNTGVYAFDHREKFRVFMCDYWPNWLGTLSRGKVYKYSPYTDEKDEKMRRFVRCVGLDGEDSFEYLMKDES